MIVKKKDAVEQLRLYKEVLATIIDKPCTIMFDMHKVDNFIVTDIIQRSLKEITHKPEKVEYEGKYRSPMVFELVNNQAPLYFLFDNTIVSALGNGVRFTVRLDTPLNNKEAVEIDIRLEG